MEFSSKKRTIVQNIQNSFSSAKAVIFYNFHHAENQEIFRLKKELKKVGAQWKVYKNNLVEKALPNYSLSLKGAHAFIFCHEDEYKPLTVLLKFNKESSADIKRFQGGIYEQKIVESSQLEKWANLPSKEVLVNTLCYYLKFPIRRLVKVLEQVKK